VSARGPEVSGPAVRGPEAARPDRIPGVPEPLPEGERVLWQGSPRWGTLALRAFHTRKVAIYFGVLVAWRIAAAIADGESFGAAAVPVVWLVAFGAAAVGILAAVAWAASRTTVYALTTRRIVMRFGIALPSTANIPLRLVDAAGLNVHADGTGDIALALAGNDRIAYMHLWPHARAWHFARPQPMLRAIPDAARVAGMLGQALAATGPGTRIPEAGQAASTAESRRFTPALS
jgi:hypothetical protein